MPPGPAAHLGGSGSQRSVECTTRSPGDNLLWLVPTTQEPLSVPREAASPVGSLTHSVQPDTGAGSTYYELLLFFAIKVLEALKRHRETW